MTKFRQELLAVKYALWELARIGPEGLERVLQASKLSEGIKLMLEPSLSPDVPDETRVRLVLEVDYRDGAAR